MEGGNHVGGLGCEGKTIIRKICEDELRSAGISLSFLSSLFHVLLYSLNGCHLVSVIKGELYKKKRIHPLNYW